MIKAASKLRFIATDVDGTLVIVGKVDGQNADENAFSEACAAVATALVLDTDFADELRAFGRSNLSGKNNEDAFKTLTGVLAQTQPNPLNGKSEQDLRKLQTCFEAKFNEIFSLEIPKSSRVRPTVVSALRRAKEEGAVLTAVSNANNVIVVQNLDLCQFGDLANVVSLDAIAVYKPQPDMYQTAFYDVLAMMAGTGIGSTPTMTCVEDSMAGFRSAVAASIELQAEGYLNPVEVLAVPFDRETYLNMSAYAKRNPQVQIRVFLAETMGNLNLEEQVLRAVTRGFTV